MSEIDSWDELADWWADQVKSDPSYRHDVLPMLSDLGTGLHGLILDLGCGEGAGIRHFHRNRVIGVDLSLPLLRLAIQHGPVVRAALPGLEWLGDEVVDGALSVYLLDLIGDFHRFFSETARVVRRSGSLVVIVNHPVYTAPGSAPFLDEDGEVLWRWGRYFDEGTSVEPAGTGRVTFQHRPVSMILNAAAEAGWVLAEAAERSLGPDTLAEHSSTGQARLPRLLGLRWLRGRLRPDAV